MTKLKSCPFCGKEVKIKVTHDDHYVIECDNCNSSTSFPYLHLRDDIINAWNTRPNPWHTGIPEEEGDYYIAFRNFIGADVEYGWASWDGEGWDINFLGWQFSNEILAWQKIDPYKEKKDGR